MKDFKADLKLIYREHRPLLYMMVGLLMLALILLIYAILNLKTGAVVKIGYGDIGRYQGGEWSSMINSGGYYDGSWVNMLAFPILAIMFGGLHNILAVKLFKKRGEGLAMVLVVMSICLVLMSFVVLGRLLGEG